jgi:hypothetical protein
LIARTSITELESRVYRQLPLDHCNSPHTQPRPSLPHHPDFQHHPQFYNATTVSYPLLMHQQQQQQQPENEYSYIADLQQPPTPTSGGHVISASGWRSDHVSGSVAGVPPGDGVNLSRPVAVIPGLARDDKLRLPQRLALKGTADHYHQKSELSGDVDADAAVSDCATISVRGVAPSNSIKSAGGCIGSTNVTDYQAAAV